MFKELHKSKALMDLAIFTDLDGTLLDHHTYSYEAAKPALTKLRELEVPIIPCTSKTRAETEVFMKELGLRSPFVVENGGAIFIPGDYFSFEFEHNKKTGNYKVIEIGSAYSDLRKIFEEVKKEYKITGFGDMSLEEIVKETGLTSEMADLARRREYDEPFLVDESDADAVINRFKESGFSVYRGGRFWHLCKGNDKGNAVKILKRLFLESNKKTKFAAIGDSSNDLAMLDEVDYPFLVKKPDGSHEKTENKKIKKIDAFGPEGWNMAILDLL